MADDELDDALTTTTVSALQSDPDLRGTWERYHLIGSAIRREPIRPEYREIAAGVRENLRAEPTVLSPAGTRRAKPSRVGPFVGVGLAAGAAFLAVFAVPQFFSPDQQTTSPGRTEGNRITRIRRS